MVFDRIERHDLGKRTKRFLLKHKKCPVYQVTYIHSAERLKFLLKKFYKPLYAPRTCGLSSEGGSGGCDCSGCRLIATYWFTAAARNLIGCEPGGWLAFPQILKVMHTTDAHLGCPGLVGRQAGRCCCCQLWIANHLHGLHSPHPLSSAMLAYIKQ